METTITSTPGKEDPSLYSSALENLTLSYSETDSSDTFIDFDVTLDDKINIGIKDSTEKLFHSESPDSLEVDPKSRLANKTIFKTDNPNLSIIEISDTPTQEEESHVYLIEPRKKNNTSHSNRLNCNLTESSSSVSVSSDSSRSEKQSKEKKRSSPRIVRVYDTNEEFEKNLPSTVTVLTTPFGSKVYLVGTAHFSEESQDDVSFVIRNVRPDIVMVELCPSRIHILKYDEKALLEEAKNFNITKIRSIVNTNGLVNGIFFMLLLHMSAQLAKKLGMAPGGEFRRAFEEVHRIPGCLLHLGDRPINITLQRSLRALSLWQIIKLVWRVMITESITAEEIEECKQRDLLEELLKEMAGEFPAFSDVFVKERDLYLCHSLQVAALPRSQPDGVPKPVKVVGVVGIGHAAGIAKNWGKVDPIKIPEILKIPPVSLSTRIFKCTVKYGFISLTIYGAYKFLRPKLQIFIS